MVTCPSFEKLLVGKIDESQYQRPPKTGIIIPKSGEWRSGLDSTAAIAHIRDVRIISPLDVT